MFSDNVNSLNQDIGYLNCKLDELKDKRARFNTRNIFKKFSFKSSGVTVVFSIIFYPLKKAFKWEYRTFVEQFQGKG